MNANPKFTNQLIKETSPYLLQHAHNPVDWVAWSSSIFNEALLQNKPILLSIGYAACHWCHVMERESFEQESVAEFMNAHFINVKVDREERPDIDHIYMDALQAMTGSGGWPLNIFLLPDGKPFFGGTYFPPSTLPQRASWMDVLIGVQQAYSNQIDKLKDQANQLTQHLLTKNITASLLTNPEIEDSIATPQEVELIGNRILQTADTLWGGFGNAPKFPQTFCLQMLLRNYKLNTNESSMVHAIRSIDKMIQGGIYDHLGGGFSRYSTDMQWQAPHFEKMLYDNALLIGLISEAYQITKKESYAYVIKQSIQFIERELSNEQGAYYAALDADSEGVEGKFYTWSYEEIKNLIDPVVFDSFCEYFQITENGNWEHTNILWTTASLDKSMSTEFIKVKDILFNQRSKRIRPALDYKIILSWNNLMIIALCKAYAALGDEQYKLKAIQSIQWVETHFSDEAHDYLFHTNTKGVKKSFAFLDDYGSLIQAYIHLQEITGDTTYLYKAKKWLEYIQIHFIDEEGLFFYYTAKYQTDVIVRQKETYDGAQPSGNALVCMSLFYLGQVFDHLPWMHQAEQMVMQMRKIMLQYPSSFSYWAQCFTRMSSDLIEIVAVGPNVQKDLKMAISVFQPNKIILFTAEEDPLLPLTIGKKSVDNQYFICVNKSCQPPTPQLANILALI